MLSEKVGVGLQLVNVMSSIVVAEYGEQKYMKIFITGSTGFIGKHLIERLIGGGHKALALTRTEQKKEGVQYIRGDLQGSKEWEGNLKKFGPEAIVHLAWEGIPNTAKELAEKNFQAGLDLIKIAKEVGCTVFLGIGSSLEYGGLEGRVQEEDAGIPPNPLYVAKTKLYQEGEKKAESLGMKFIWTRPFYVYGPGQREDSLLPHLITAYKKGEHPEIKNPDGANDFIYVKDVADAIALLLEKNAPQGAYNIGSGHPTSVREMVGITVKALGIPMPELPPPKRSPNVFFADITKIEKAVGWKPRTSLEKGVKNMIS